MDGPVIVGHVKATRSPLIRLGYRTILVLSGGTKRADLVRYAFQPDLVVDSVRDLIESGVIATRLPAPNLDDDSLDLNKWRSAAGEETDRKSVVRERVSVLV